MKRKLFLCLYAVALCLAAYAQDPAAAAVGSSAQPSGDAANVSSYSFEALSALPAGRALLAATNPDYPVCPGDVYQLSFMSARGLESVTLVVDVDMRVNAGVFGVLDAKGKTFAAFRSSVELAVNRAYPGSSAQLIIQSTGVYKVMILGEVRSAGEAQAWGLLRLSSIVSNFRTAYSSSRSVRIRSVDGSQHSYDLFLASRFGQLEQDPYLKPGDIIELSRSQRTVSITGEVRRPGSYELLPGEQLQRLVDYYADGFTQKANPDRLSVISVADGLGSETQMGSRRYFHYHDKEAEALLHLDTVLVPSIDELKPVVWFEGALGQRDGTSLDSSSRRPYTFVPGELLSTAVRSIAGLFSGESDLEHAYILRLAERIPVNLTKYLYEKDYSNDFPLQPGDVVVVPFRQLFVTVSGAVKTPGRYPYIPDRSWDYYIALAGGFDTDRNVFQAIRITDMERKPYGKERSIQPEDIIEAKSNSFVYSFGRVSGIIGTIISVASLALGIYNMSR